MNYVLVTGAASDIGKAICKELVNQGYYLLMLDIDDVSMSDFISKLEKPEKHFSLKVDFSIIDESENLIKSFIEDKKLIVESAVFAAGIFSIKPLRMVNHDYFLKSFDISVFSIFTIMKILTSKKINNDNLRSVVILSSISAKKGTKGYALYGAVKASLLGLMRSLAVEFAPNVRVNAILPGSIRTKATAFIFNSTESLSNQYLLGEGHPSDIANIIKFLVSEESSWITGQEFIIDGGIMIK